MLQEVKCNVKKWKAKISKARLEKYSDKLRYCFCDEDKFFV